MPRGPKYADDIYANSYQHIHERIKWLRQRQKPYMTQEQLAIAAGIDLSHYVKIENGYSTVRNIRIDTLRKIANAMDCDVVIKITARKRGAPSAEFLPSGPPLQPPPKRSRKMTGKARSLAGSVERSPWLKSPRA